MVRFDSDTQTCKPLFAGTKARRTEGAVGMGVSKLES